MLQEPQTTLNPQCSFKRQTWLECVTVTEGIEGAAHNGSIVRVLPRPRQGPRILCVAPCLNERENLNVEQISAKQIKAWEGGLEEKTNVDFFQVREKEAVPYKNIRDTVYKRGIVLLRWD